MRVVGELGDEVHIGEEGEPQMSLEVVKDYFVQLTRYLWPAGSRLERWQSSAHRDVVRLQLRDVVLAEAAWARTHPIAELADPTPIVLAHVEVILVEAHEASMAELSIAAIVWHLGKLEVSFDVDIRKLFSVNLQ